MHRRATTRANHRTAFTLIEVLMVLLILAALLGLILNLSRHASETAKRAQALADLGELHHGIDRFFSENEAYPDPTTTEPVAVTNAILWTQPPSWAVTTNALAAFLPEGFTGVDPWGQAYLYQHDATNAPLTYQLYSLGTNTNDPHARIDYQP